MARRLFKLSLTATTTTKAKPTASNFLTKLTVAFSGTKLTILASKFFNNAGTALTASGLTVKTASNGFYLLFIDGVLQETALYTVTAANVIISTSSAFTLPVSTPITLSVTNFSPSSITTISY